MTYLRTVRQLGSIIHLVFEIKFQRIHKPSHIRGLWSAVRIFNFLSLVTIQLDLYLVEITSVTEKLKLEFSLYKLPYIRYKLIGRIVQPRGRGSISSSVTCFSLL